MTARRRGRLIVGLVAAVLALAGSGLAASAMAGRSPVVMSGPGPGPGAAGRYGPGMMAGGGMMGAGMMAGGTGGRYGLAGDGRAVTTLAAARARAQAFADRLGGLRAGEVMQFANGYYSELLTATGAGATEVLVDPATGAVGIEYGPAMRWNTSYGMRALGDAPARVSAAQAVSDAQAWLDARHSGLTAGDATAFPGYYTLHTRRGGAIAGMMSVNAADGAVWYHTWHGAFVAMAGE